MRHQKACQDETVIVVSRWTAEEAAEAAAGRGAEGRAAGEREAGGQKVHKKNQKQKKHN